MVEEYTNYIYIIIISFYYNKFDSKEEERHVFPRRRLTLSKNDGHGC